MPRLGGDQCQKLALVAAPLVEEKGHERLVWEKHPDKGLWGGKKSSKFFSGTCVGAVQEGLIAHG